MAANSLFAGAVQILCYLAYVGEATTAERLASSLKTNPVVARRILKQLAARDLVAIRQGRHGGVSLKRSPTEIRLDEVHAAVGEGDSRFAFRERGNPRCPVSRSMPALLTPVFAAADEAVAQTLAQTSLSSLVARCG